jgi:hypothetical protein
MTDSDIPRLNPVPDTQPDAPKPTQKQFKRSSNPRTFDNARRDKSRGYQGSARNAQRPQMRGRRGGR